MKIRRVATGHTAAGKAVIVSDTEVDADKVSLLPGVQWHQLWGADRPPSFPDDGSRPREPFVLSADWRLPFWLVHFASTVRTAYVTDGFQTDVGGDG